MRRGMLVWVRLLEPLVWQLHCFKMPSRIYAAISDNCGEDIELGAYFVGFEDHFPSCVNCIPLGMRYVNKTLLPTLP